MRSAVGRAVLFRSVALVLGVASGVVIARLGGAELKGVASAFAAANAVAFMFINFDAAQQALRLSRTEGSKAYAWALLRWVWGAYVVLGGGALLAAALWGADALWIVAGATAFALGAQAGVAAVGMKGPVVGAVGAVIQQLALIIAVCVLASLGALDGESIKLATVVSYVAPTVIYVPYVLRAASGDRRRVSAGDAVLSLAKGLPWQAGRLMQVCLQKLDVLAVFAVLGAAAAGQYSVGVSTAMLCTLVPAQFAGQALHDAVHGREAAALNRIRRGLYSGAAVGIGLAGVGYPLITLLYGAEFTDAYSVLLATLPGAIAYGVVQVQSNYIRVTSAWYVFFAIGAAGVFVMLVAIVAFTVVVPLGMVGVGIGFSAGAITTAGVGMIPFVRRQSEPSD